MRGGTAWLHCCDKDADLIPSRQTDAHAAGLLEADEAGVGAASILVIYFLSDYVIDMTTSRSLTDFLFLQSSADLLRHNLKDK